MNTPIVEASEIVKNYQKETTTIPVLRSVCLRMVKGEFLAIMGASGSGKSTLLNIIGCLDRPTTGSYLLDGVDVLKSSDDQLSRMRSRYLGFVFQTFNLISNLTVFENIELPFLYHTIQKEISERVHTAIEQVGLSDRINHRPAELSGGEMQRVSIARALAIEPKLILADEPTGNLDSLNSREIMLLFKRLHNQGGTIILVTHDPQVASYADSCVTISDGQIIGESL
ncbi:MAG: ABC transporter ATP-binding protein [Desulfobacteraceae bacterium]|nr:ABC transporter ATP-binding protein [Desulfobacteraceae bacterium]